MNEKSNIHLFHESSTNPMRKPGDVVWDDSRRKFMIDPESPASEYNRDFDTYILELERKFIPQDWVGKKVLDIGAGAYDRFGREGRKRGIDIISINPALQDERSISYLQTALDYDYQEKKDTASFDFKNQPLWKKIFSRMSGIKPEESKVIEAFAQNMPFENNSFDAIVSVYGVPQYLHHLDPSIEGDDNILRAYTEETRNEDKQEITTAFNEIVRVLKPNGKAFLTDDHRGINQIKDINVYSPSDGSEVIEVLEDLKSRGLIDYEVFERQHIGSETIKRVIVLTKTNSN